MDKRATALHSLHSECRRYSRSFRSAPSSVVFLFTHTVLTSASTLASNTIAVPCSSGTPTPHTRPSTHGHPPSTSPSSTSTNPYTDPSPTSSPPYRETHSPPSIVPATSYPAAHCPTTPTRPRSRRSDTGAPQRGASPSSASQMRDTWAPIGRSAYVCLRCRRS